MTSRHLRESGCEVGRAERQRGGNAQTTAKVSRGQDCFLSQIDLGTHSGCIIAERGTGLGERRAAGRSCEKLDAKFRFKSQEPPADD